VRSGCAAKSPLISFREKPKIYNILPGRQKNFSKISDSGVQKRRFHRLPPGRILTKMQVAEKSLPKNL
jgi:hypothetical protein